MTAPVVPCPQPHSSPQNSSEASYLSHFISLSEAVLWLRGCSARRDIQEVSGNGCPRNVPFPVMGEPMDKHPASSSTMEKARDCRSVSQMPGGAESHSPRRAASLALSPSLLTSPLPPQSFLGTHPKYLSSTQILVSGSAIWGTRTKSPT